MCENELPSSELGTFKHWDNAYKTELVLFRDIGDPGTEWFGRSSTKRMVSTIVVSISEQVISSVAGLWSQR